MTFEVIKSRSDGKTILDGRRFQIAYEIYAHSAARPTFFSITSAVIGRSRIWEASSAWYISGSEASTINDSRITTNEQDEKLASKR